VHLFLFKDVTNMVAWHIKPFQELTLNELYAILRLRQEVFVVEQNCPYLDADGKDKHSHHLMGFIENDLAAYARLVFPGISYPEVSIGRVVTSSKYRGGGYGKQLMRRAIEETTGFYGKIPIRIGAQKYLKNFYEGFGFMDIGEPYIEDGIPHMIMLKTA
jgi:ElaA protein